MRIILSALSFGALVLSGCANSESTLETETVPQSEVSLNQLPSGCIPNQTVTRHVLHTPAKDVLRPNGETVTIPAIYRVVTEQVTVCKANTVLVWGDSQK